MKATDVFIPSAAVILYSIKDNSAYSTRFNDDDVYFEVAPIINGKMGAAIPLSKRYADKMSKALSKKSNTMVGGIVPEGVLSIIFKHENMSLTWYTGPQRRKLLFSKTLNISNGYANLPGLVWSIHDKQLKVAVMLEKPTMKSKVYKAPFHNISSAGVVCLGTGWKQLEAEFKTFTSTIKAAESAFFTTIFNEIQDQNIVHGNLNSIYKSIVNTDKPFPVKAFVDTKTTLKDILKNNR